MRHLANDLRRIPGVVAVSLGGSRATGRATASSDWDVGLYYRGALDTDAIRGLGRQGRVFEPGEWGRVVNGGAWLEVDGEKVDLIYRDLDEVEMWAAEAERGRFEIEPVVGYVAGIATYVLAGELALNEVLAGDLPRPSFPAALRATAPPQWGRLAGGALHYARVHLARGDVTATMANLGQAVLSTAQARLASRGEWALNEKGVVDRAGLADAHTAISNPDLGAAIENVSRLLEVDWV